MKISFPQMGASQIAPIILALNNLGGSARLESLAPALNLAEGTLNNYMTTLVALDLVRQRRRTLFLTEYGRELAHLLEEKSYDALAPFFDRVVKRSPVLSLAAEILRVTPEIDNATLGQRLCFRFKKKSDSDYCKRVGRNSAEIVRFFNKEAEDRMNLAARSSMMVRPKLTYQKIERLIDQASLGGIVDRSGEAMSTREIDDFSTLVSLKLVEKIGKNKFKLTDLGQEFRTSSNRKNTFARVLVGNEFVREWVAILRDKGVQYIDSETLSRAIGETNPLWGIATLQEFGKSFRNWLDNAGLIQNVRYGKYQFTRKALDMIPQTERTSIEANSTESQAIVNSTTSTPSIERTHSELVVPPPLESNSDAFPDTERTVEPYMTASFKDLLSDLYIHLLALRHEVAVEEMEQIDGILKELLQDRTARRNLWLHFELEQLEKMVRRSLRSQDQNDWKATVEFLRDFHAHLKRV